MNENKQQLAAVDEPSKLRSFTRNHPIIAIASAGGLGLLAGPELAAGILLGAAVDALIRRRNGHTNVTDAHALRDRTRTLLDRIPATVRERARAVYAAARGKQPAGSETQPATDSQPTSTTETL